MFAAFSKEGAERIDPIALLPFPFAASQQAEHRQLSDETRDIAVGLIESGELEYPMLAVIQAIREVGAELSE